MLCAPLGRLNRLSETYYGEGKLMPALNAINEVLCMIVCHDLTCLIQEQEPLGSVQVFWQDEEEADAPAILRMPGCF